VTQFTVDANLFGTPFAKKDSVVWNHVRVVEDPRDLLNQSFLDIGTKAGRQIDVGDRRCGSPSNQMAVLNIADDI